MSVRRKKKGKKFDGPGPGSGMLPWCPPHPGGLKPFMVRFGACLFRMVEMDKICPVVYERKDGNRKGEVTLWVVTVAGLPGALSMLLAPACRTVLSARYRDLAQAVD